MMSLIIHDAVAASIIWYPPHPVPLTTTSSTLKLTQVHALLKIRENFKDVISVRHIVPTTYIFPSKRITTFLNLLHLFVCVIELPHRLLSVSLHIAFDLSNLLDLELEVETIFSGK